jgi:Aldehyde oxidase and xanthine dehydrogenase, a/b hammerhead domain/Molybdopterin-binding domain of aldehyde dehydrogenase
LDNQNQNPNHKSAAAPAAPAQPADRVYGAGYKLIGKNYETPDLYAKVTGNAKYAEDFRADGMLFCKLLLSPMPHARVRHIDAKAALAMPGVKAILTADDLPAPADTLTDNGTVIKASKWGERGLTMEPVYQGEPVLAVAAIDELTAAEAIERIHVDFEPLPFVMDPLDTLRPGGPNPRTDGNVWTRPPASASQGPGAPAVTELKWTEADFAELKNGRLPRGKTPDEWTHGDLDSGFKDAALVLDETFVTPDTSHQTLETRSAMAYWQNGKVYIYTGTQSTAQTLPALVEYRSRKGCVRERVHRRGVREQDHGRGDDDHPGAAGEEGERSSNDAHHPRRRNLHWARPPQFSRKDESWFLERGTDHGSRHVRDLRQRPL